MNYGPFWASVLPAWERRNEPNILFITYEQMKRDLKSVINLVAEFLEKTLSDVDIEKLIDHLSFDSMKNNKSLNLQDEITFVKNIFKNDTGDLSFIRSGKVGGYKANMSNETMQQFDKWTEDHTKNTGLKFDGY